MSVGSLFGSRSWPPPPVSRTAHPPDPVLSGHASPRLAPAAARTPGWSRSSAVAGSTGSSSTSRPAIAGSGGTIRACATSSRPPAWRSRCCATGEAAHRDPRCGSHPRSGRSLLHQAARPPGGGRREGRTPGRRRTVGAADGAVGPRPRERSTGSACRRRSFAPWRRRPDWTRSSTAACSAMRAPRGRNLARTPPKC